MTDSESQQQAGRAIHWPLVGIDVGGTFTDFVVYHEGNLRFHKQSTTPDDQSRAIVVGLRALGLPTGVPAQIVHGMTVATNALLERKVARTALLTTAGFGDVLAIGRQNRPHLYNLTQARPPSLVADDLRLEVAERLDAEGNVVTALDEAAVERLADVLEQARAESLAIVFLFSFRNPLHEQRAAEIVRSRLPDLPISLSSEILPEYREYERAATTVINASVQPIVARYLHRLEQALREGEEAPHAVRILQSNGGAIGLEQAARQPARLVLSGPAGGVVGAFAVARQATPPTDAVRILTFDMGGTSTDVALCPGAIPTTAESQIGDLPLRLPIIDIHTVGAGGGSIAFVDVGGALRVWPRSAGAVPGPVAYGRGGTEPTVTDANVVLGRLDPAGFLGGRGDVSLDVEAARAALARLGAPLGLSAEEAALGVIRVANAAMERALRTVSVERGHDPRPFTLLPFGGAGPLHACELAASLGIHRVLVPPMPGVLSAWGMLVAPVSSDASLSILRDAATVADEPAALAQAVATLARRVEGVLRGEGIANASVDAMLDMRYRGQSYEITVGQGLPVDGQSVADAIEAFHGAHAQRYGYARRGEPVEIVTLRVRREGVEGSRVLGFQGSSVRAPAGAKPAPVGERLVWFDAQGPTKTPYYDREQLGYDTSFAGPALVRQYDATTLIAPGWGARVDAWGNLVIRES